MSETFIVGEREYMVFHESFLSSSLSLCHRAGFESPFAPELVDLLIAHPQLIQCAGRSLSACITGKSAQGNPIQIYLHAPISEKYITKTYFCSGSDVGLHNEALVISQEYFLALEKRDGENLHGTRLVTVLDSIPYSRDAAYSWFDGYSIWLKFEEALENSHVQAFFGSLERAEGYFQTLRKASECGHKVCEKVGFWYSNDLDEVERNGHPLRRALVTNYFEFGCRDFKLVKAHSRLIGGRSLGTVE